MILAVVVALSDFIFYCEGIHFLALGLCLTFKGTSMMLAPAGESDLLPPVNNSLINGIQNGLNVFLIC